MGQPTIIKWFKRFRKVCCQKGKLSPLGLRKGIETRLNAYGPSYAMLKSRQNIGRIWVRALLKHKMLLLEHQCFDS